MRAYFLVMLFLVNSIFIKVDICYYLITQHYPTLNGESQEFQYLLPEKLV